MDSSEMGRRGAEARYAGMTREERSQAAREAARARWGEKSEVTALAEREGISRQAAWARLRKANGRKTAKKGKAKKQAGVRVV